MSHDAYPQLRSSLLERLKTFENRTDWKTSSAPPNVEALVLDTPELAYPIVRCRVLLGCQPHVLHAFLVTDVTHTLKEWSRDIDECSELERVSDSERILLIRTRAPVPLIAAREDVFYQHECQLEGACIEVSQVIDRPEPLPAKGSVRSEMHFASKRIVPHEKGCHYDVMWQYDPSGWMTKLLPIRVVLHSIHDHLKNECVRLLNKFPLPT